MANPQFNTILAEALAKERQMKYEMEQEEYLNSLSLGAIEGLSDDAKMLIYMNPKIINDLAAAILGNNQLMAITKVKRLTVEESK